MNEQVKESAKYTTLIDYGKTNSFLEKMDVNYFADYLTSSFTVSHS